MSFAYDSYDPNTAELYIVVRSGWQTPVKGFVSRGPALNSYHSCSKAKLFQQIDGEFKLIAYKSNEPENTCNVCHKAITANDSVVGPYNWHNNYCIPRRGGKIIEPLRSVFACKYCIKRLGL